MNAEKLRAVIHNERLPEEVRKRAMKMLANADKKRAKRKPMALGPKGLRRYRVHGVWKLTERIADFDPEGDVINGWSDRL